MYQLPNNVMKSLDAMENLEKKANQDFVAAVSTRPAKREAVKQRVERLEGGASCPALPVVATSPHPSRCTGSKESSQEMLRRSTSAAGFPGAKCAAAVPVVSSVTPQVPSFNLHPSSLTAPPPGSGLSGPNVSNDLRLALRGDFAWMSTAPTPSTRSRSSSKPALTSGSGTASSEGVAGRAMPALPPLNRPAAVPALPSAVAALPTSALTVWERQERIREMLRQASSGIPTSEGTRYGEEANRAGGLPLKTSPSEAPTETGSRVRSLTASALTSARSQVGMVGSRT